MKANLFTAERRVVIAALHWHNRASPSGLPHPAAMRRSPE